MRRWSLASLVLALPLLSALASGPVQADDDDDKRYHNSPGGQYGNYDPYGGYGQYNRLPGGSWLRSCKNIEVRGGELFADCRRPNGNWNRAGIAYRQCPGGLMNNGGRLECEGGGWNGWGNNGNNGWGNGGWGNMNNARVPEGSFRSTCKQERVERGYVLVANCRDWNGNYRQTALDLRQCRGDISNRGGELNCRRGNNGNWWSSN